MRPRGRPRVRFPKDGNIPLLPCVPYFASPVKILHSLEDCRATQTSFRFMLLIVTTAFIATGAFFREAQRVGIHPGKAASVPFLNASILLSFSLVASHCLSGLSYAFEASPQVEYFIGLMLNLMILCLFFRSISLSWKSLFIASQSFQ